MFTLPKGMNYMRSKYLYLIIIVLFIGLISCGSEDDQEGGNEIPSLSELSVVIAVIGADSSNPNGDGSGQIACVATAKNASKFVYTFVNGEEVTSIDGKENYTFIDKGTNNFTINISALNSNNQVISISKTVKVFVNDEMQLVWSDEFDTDGAPDDTKWGYDLGDGCPNICGWGNNEKEYYTNRSENVIVEDGVLKITAKKENYEGSQYTSTRMLTKGKFEFTYAKVEVRAKLPEGGGTWPAIWMLGANIGTVGWPGCGEIDIMEHVGNNQGAVSSALHTTSSSGNTINKGEQYIDDVSSEYHVYSVDWMPKKIIFSVDDVVHYTYNILVKNSSNWPFTDDQFLILNIAMGGGFGGNIDPSFIESTMEIDYVRVYQK